MIINWISDDSFINNKFLCIKIDMFFLQTLFLVVIVKLATINVHFYTASRNATLGVYPIHIGPAHQRAPMVCFLAL